MSRLYAIGGCSIVGNQSQARELATRGNMNDWSVLAYIKCESGKVTCRLYMYVYVYI